MDAAVGIEDNDEGKVEDCGIEKISSVLSSPKQIANPVVYKLVRVEGDGRLVPATDDEVIRVEDFLEDENSEMHVVADTGQSVGCISIERSSSGRLRVECSKGVSQSDTAESDLGKLNARLQMLQKVKQEEKLRLACGSPDHVYVNTDSQCSADKFPVADGMIQSDISRQEVVPSLAPSVNDSHSNQSVSIGQCSRPSEGLVESGSSTSAVYYTFCPDFSMLKEEICLDKLSIRELHELFKVTFGRETTVKDKQWLKRRIAMSLTNSCDVSTTTFIVRDNKLVKKCEKESCGNANAVLSVDATAGEMDVNSKDPLPAEGSGIDDNQAVSGKRLRNHDMEPELGNEDLQTGEKAAKRVRKPTKRYIEELSENEPRDHNQRFLSSNKNTGIGQFAPNSYMRPSRNMFSEGRTVFTRLDSLGGSGIQVPCVSRVRRSRPRKNIMSLMFHPCGTGNAIKLVDKPLGVHGSQTDSESRDETLTTPAECQQWSVAESGQDEQCPVLPTIELRQEFRLKKADPTTHISDDKMVTVPTSKGGMRRKHHRAWTLVEVMKLVEGVSRCGAGRWSEIKRLAFASYSYRTSVDLKLAKYMRLRSGHCSRNTLKADFTVQDKWRNLLKASFAQAPADEGVRVCESDFCFTYFDLVEVRCVGIYNLVSSAGACCEPCQRACLRVEIAINSRKHGTVPIPEQILVRVRELAELNSQVPPNLSSSKLTVGAKSMREDKSAGYL